MIHASKVRDKSYPNKESEEFTCGPRAQSNIIEHQESGHSFKSDEYNLDGFKTKYEQAKFYIIKSYSEDDVHKCVKYDVWSSTPNGNKKLDVAFHEAEGRTRETGLICPVFLFFSVSESTYSLVGLTFLPCGCVKGGLFGIYWTETDVNWTNLALGEKLQHFMPIKKAGEFFG